MTFEAVIFDLDNTLLNRRIAFSNYARNFAHHFLDIHTDSQLDEAVAYLVKADCDGYRNKQELYTTVLANFSMKNPNITVDQLLTFWFSEFPLFTTLMDGAIEILTYLKLKEMRLGVITNGKMSVQRAKIEQIGLKDYFEVIIVSEEVGIKKPDKRIFELVANKLKINPQKCLFVGDQPLNDVVGAQQAGMKGVWLEGFAEWNMDSEKPSYCIQSLSQLKDIVETNS